MEAGVGGDSLIPLRSIWRGQAALPHHEHATGD